MEAAKRGPIRVEPSPDDDSQRAIGSQGALPPFKASAMETTDMVARSASATANGAPMVAAAPEASQKQVEIERPSVRRRAPIRAAFASGRPPGAGATWLAPP
jgi:hypothetical protein